VNNDARARAILIMALALAADKEPAPAPPVAPVPKVVIRSTFVPVFRPSYIPMPSYTPSMMGAPAMQAPAMRFAAPARGMAACPT